MNNTNAYLIKNGQVIDPSTGTNQVMDVLIEGGKVIQLAENISNNADVPIIDASNMIVCPGLVDLCHHLREPGKKHKGTIASETYAAVSGGVTTICCPPDTSPIIDNKAVIKLIRVAEQEKSYINIHLMGALTKGLEGKELSQMNTLMNSGCVGVTNLLEPITDTLVMRRAMEYALTQGITVHLYPQDYWLSRNGCAHDGAVSARLGLSGIPESAETIALLRDLELVELTGVKAHFSHISSAKGIDIIRQAKQRGLDITADVTINHLHLTEMDIGFFQSDCHCIPPFRTQRDKDALIAGIQDDTIDVIVSDHQSHDADAKLAPFPETEPGLSSTETYLALACKLTEITTISIDKILSKLTCEPAKILGLKAGTLAKDSNADICIFDLNSPWSVDKKQLLSVGKNTPFHGWELSTKVKYTFVDGRCVYQQAK
ncbi:MAG: dihydroorotase [Gammaproteobacteria bacterium]|nr:dihydroorotase [Gammaproteobacteria bacterium]